MSSDNYNWVDYHPADPRGAFSVTNGFASDDAPPTVPNGSTRYFATRSEAEAYAINDWTEYGYVYSPAFSQYIREAVRKYEERRA